MLTDSAGETSIGRRNARIVKWLDHLSGEAKELQISVRASNTLWGVNKYFDQAVTRVSTILRDTKKAVLHNTAEMNEEELKGAICHLCLDAVLPLTKSLDDVHHVRAWATKRFALSTEKDASSEAPSFLRHLKRFYHDPAATKFAVVAMSCATWKDYLSMFHQFMCVFYILENIKARICLDGLAEQALLELVQSIDPIILSCFDFSKTAPSKVVRRSFVAEYIFRWVEPEDLLPTRLRMGNLPASDFQDLFVKVINISIEAGPKMSGSKKETPPEKPLPRNEVHIGKRLGKVLDAAIILWAISCISDDGNSVIADDEELAKLWKLAELPMKKVWLSGTLPEGET